MASQVFPFSPLQPEVIYHSPESKRTKQPTVVDQIQQYSDDAWKLLQRYAQQRYDALNLYRPLPSVAGLSALDLLQVFVLLITGSNQAGKTLAASELIARIVRGLCPSFGEPGIMLCVGKDSDHISQTQWPKLTQPGAFDIIRDEVTGAWRGVRVDPNNPTQIDPVDLIRRGEWAKSPPLIPEYEIKQIAWEDKKRGIPKVVHYKSGWTQYWHTSEGKPRNGIQIKSAWFDEEVDGRQWLGETLARFLRHKGLFIWSCTPQNATLQLLDLHLKAMSGLPGFVEYSLKVDDNPYFDDESKRRFFDSVPEDERAVRYYGEYAILGRRIYPEYGNIHQIQQHAVPDDWMRVLVVDPGTQVAAALLAAVPPPQTVIDDHGNATHKQPQTIHVYDEIYQKNSDAAKFAEAVKQKIGDDRFETFIIDKHGGDQRPMGCENTVADHYAEEFERVGVKSTRSGHGFEWGSPDTESRRLALKRWMRGNDPTLRIHSNCLNLDKELRNRYYKKDDAERDRPDDRRPHHLVDCIEYLAAYFDDGLYHREPEGSAVKDNSLWAYRSFLAKRRMLEEREPVDD